jgi:hypothetical protein
LQRRITRTFNSQCGSNCRNDKSGLANRSELDEYDATTERLPNSTGSGECEETDIVSLKERDYLIDQALSADQGRQKDRQSDDMTLGVFGVHRYSASFPGGLISFPLASTDSVVAVHHRDMILGSQ